MLFSFFPFLYSHIPQALLWYPHKNICDTTQVYMAKANGAIVSLKMIAIPERVLILKAY